MPYHIHVTDTYLDDPDSYCKLVTYLFKVIRSYQSLTMLPMDADNHPKFMLAMHIMMAYKSFENK